MNQIARLHRAIRGAAVPLQSVRMLDQAQTPPHVELVFEAVVTPTQRAQAQAIVDAFDWSDAAGKKAMALTGLDDAMILKALTIAIFTTLKAKNPVVQLPTLAEVKAAFVNAINAGQAD